MPKENYRYQGRQLNATDLADRLLPDLNMNELLLWSPDLFAYTSYIMSTTGTYQLVVSPPSGEKWKPLNEDIKGWLGIKLDKNYSGKNASNTIDCQGLKDNLIKWLRSIMTDVEADKEKFWFEPSEWLPYRENGYFDKNFVSRVNKKLPFEERLIDIAEYIQEHVEKSLAERKPPKKNPNQKNTACLGELLKKDKVSNWVQLVQKIGDDWGERLNKIEPKEFYLINDAELDVLGNPKRDKKENIIKWLDFPQYGDKKKGNKLREKELLGLLLKNTPPLLLAIWAYFYNQVTDKKFYSESSPPFYTKENCCLNIADLLCNQDHLQAESSFKSRLWCISQSLLTMHAIADICCYGWGLESAANKSNSAQQFAESLLFKKGSLATINPERCRVMPKRHNPGVGITLRSISSNLGFHRSSVEVVWRKTRNTVLEEQWKEEKEVKTLSLLLLPFPLEIKAREFRSDNVANEKVDLPDNREFFTYEPNPANADFTEKIIDLIKKSAEELPSNRSIDVIAFPETSLSREQFDEIERELLKKGKSKDLIPPSIFIAGVRESRSNIADEINLRRKELKNQGKVFADECEGENECRAEGINFPRNVVYCKYFNQKDKKAADDGNKPDVEEDKKGYGEFVKLETTPKYKQYKHHRWKLDKPQIKQYGLSRILDTKDDKNWWESIKIPKRRVSFLNVGSQITISNLICEDLARQDPIADLIRHVGPSLVVTLLMDGPQLKSRWSSRYANILSDDPGSSVITLTSWGMVKRHSSAYGLMTRVVALWSESNGPLREIELAEGAEAILLTLRLDDKYERTADGREERKPTSVLRLDDVVQIYPSKNASKSVESNNT